MSSQCMSVFHVSACAGLNAGLMTCARESTVGQVSRVLLTTRCYSETRVIEGHGASSCRVSPHTISLSYFLRVKNTPPLVSGSRRGQGNGTHVSAYAESSLGVREKGEER